MKAELLKDLELKRKALAYTETALASDLEKWERKEYELVKANFISEIESLERRISFCF